MLSRTKEFLGTTDSCTNCKTQRNIKRKNRWANKNLKIGLPKLTSHLKLTPTRSNLGKSSKSKSSPDLVGVHSVNGHTNREALILPSTTGEYTNIFKIQTFIQLITRILLFFVNSKVIKDFRSSNGCFHQSKFWPFVNRT